MAGTVTTSPRPRSRPRHGIAGTYITGGGGMETPTALRSTATAPSARDPPPAAGPSSPRAAPDGARQPLSGVRASAHRLPRAGRDPRLRSALLRSSQRLRCPERGPARPPLPSPPLRGGRTGRGFRGPRPMPEGSAGRAWLGLAGMAGL